MTGIAGTPDQLIVFVGSGWLPRYLVGALESRGAHVCRIALAGSVPGWLRDDSHVTLVTFDDFIEKLNIAAERGYRDIAFAGGIRRPTTDSVHSDSGRSVVAQLSVGDDSAVRYVLERVQALGLNILGVHQLLPELLPRAGIPTRRKPDESDVRDASRAAEIVSRLGDLDLGQAAAVAQGICLGIEIVSGTDAMIASAGSLRGYLPNLRGAEGVIYKAAKPSQDLRMDFPVVGPATICKTAEAGFAGVVIATDQVLLLEPERTRQLADERGIFLWSREPVT